MLTIFVLSLVACASAVTFPKEWERCKVSPSTDFKPNECIRRTTSNIVRHLSKDGEPSLDIVDMDPMRIGKIDIGEGVEGAAVSFKAEFTDNDLYGFSNVDIKSMDGKFSSPEGWSMHCKAYVKEMSLVGKYKIDGRLLVFPLKGDGTSNITIQGVNLDYRMNGKPRIKNGVEYLKLVNNSYEFKETKALINFGNLFSGNKVLEDSVNRVLTDNAGLLFDELRPSITKIFAKEVLKYMKLILERIPYKDLVILEE